MKINRNILVDGGVIVFDTNSGSVTTLSAQHRNYVNFPVFRAENLKCDSYVHEYMWKRLLWYFFNIFIFLCNLGSSYFFTITIAV